MSENISVGAQTYPGQPGLILDCVPTEPLVDAAWAANQLQRPFRADIRPGLSVAITSVSPARVYAAERVSPLVLRILQDEPVTRHDIRERASDIIRLKPFARAASLTVPGAYPLMRRYIGNNFERMVRDAVQKPGPTRDKIASSFAKALPFAQVIGQFDDPRQQMGQELSTVAVHIRTVAHRCRAGQIGNRPDMDDHVTAEDAAVGIEHLVQTMLAPAEQNPTYLPMIRGLARAALAAAQKSPNQVLGKVSNHENVSVIAQNVMQVLYDTLPQDQGNYRFLDSLRRTAPFKRLGAEVVYGRRISAVTRNTPTLLRALRDLMPTRGSDVAKIWNRLHGLLQPPLEPSMSDSGSELAPVR